MELNLRLGADGYGTTRKRITSGGERVEPPMELCVGSGGAGTGRPSEEVSSDSAAEDCDPLLLPLLGGGGWKGGIGDERSREGTVIGAAVRKKLRLSKEQSSFLEQCFREHQTLSSDGKLDIAKQLNLRPRQIEVWFQNRRARSKTKHMQEDCSYLRKQCKSLTEENTRLQQELLHLRQLKASSSAVIHLQPAAPCPSCKRSGPTSASAPFD